MLKKIENTVFDSVHKMPKAPKVVPKVSCGCCSHRLPKDATTRLEAIDMKDLVYAVQTPHSGWNMVARTDLKKGTLLGVAECNVKFERPDAFSSSSVYEMVGDIDPPPGLFAGWTPLLCPIKDQLLRYGNLPLPPPSMMHASEADMTTYIDKNHNAAILTAHNWPFMGAVVCRPIKAGEHIKLHYGPSSHEIAFRAMREVRSD